MLRFRFLVILSCFLFLAVPSVLAKKPTHKPRIMIPLHGSVQKFSELYGPVAFDSKVIKYKTSDGARIEATLLTTKDAPAKPGLVFVHMWARDRNTWWGLPEYLASYGYSSIAMDLRGHGNSNLPNSKYRYTTDDKRKSYKNSYLDVIHAIDILNEQASVVKNQLILLGASLGCPIGVNAAKERKHDFIGMIHLSPSIIYFDVNCRKALKELSHLPNYVIAEATDASFSNAIAFLNISNHYKTFYRLHKTGHGTNILFHDLGIPTVILSWVEQMAFLNTTLRRIANSPMLVPVKK